MTAGNAADTSSAGQSRPWKRCAASANATTKAIDAHTSWIGNARSPVPNTHPSAESSASHSGW